jgi:tRNA-splicing ligase RtcB
MKVFTDGRIPIKMWADRIDNNALEQAYNLASLPFAFHHIALMPDVHCGLGMPIGGVLATDGVVIPNAVGVDIGCGMCAIKTSLRVEDIDNQRVRKVLSLIRNVIPLGFDHHKQLQDEALLPQGHNIERLPYVKTLQTAARHQLGTLGGGNHFIEIQRASTGEVWIMIHSGSRNVGKQVADRHNKIAKRLNERWHSNIIDGLAFLPIESAEGKEYWNEMLWCVDFALCNRRVIMNRICEAFTDVFPDVVFEPMINIAHNYAVWEHHFGKNVIVHRKGATRAYNGEIGIIPGSQGTKSYIVQGLGNPESFMSCSHGAGRVLGRKEACRVLDLKREIKKLDALGIIHGIRTQHNLDEAPSAYKDIEIVMSNQKDLVCPIVELSPIAVIKGD